MSLTTVSIKNSIHNLGYNISLLPYIVELNVLSNINIAKAKKAERKEERKEKKAEKSKQQCEEKEEMKDDIKESQKESDSNHEDSKDQKESKAEVTKKWLEYTMYYMTDPNAQLLENLSKSQKSLINGIAKYFNFGNIYQDIKVADIEFYDKSFKDKYNEFSKYEISIKNDILPLLDNEEFMNKLEARKQQLYGEKSQSDIEEEVNETKTVINETTEQIAKNKPEDISVEEVVVEEKSESVKNEDIGQIIHPISFETLKKEEKTEKDELETELKTATSESIKEEELKTEKQNKVTSTDTKLNPKMFKRLENIFVPIIGKKNHKYEIDGDFINIHIYKKDKKETYVIDPGVCMGKGKIYLLTKVPTDTLFVSTEHKDIIRKVLSDKEYVLNPSEIQKVILDYFRNMNIYRYIDMNKTEFLSKINEEDFQKLGKKLTFIINQKINNECRFRFLNWESVDKFAIISDSSVKSPLSNTGETSNKITEGLTYIVEGDNITQKMGDKINMLQIQQYGDM